MIKNFLLLLLLGGLLISCSMTNGSSQVVDSQISKTASITPIQPTTTQTSTATITATASSTATPTKTPTPIPIHTATWVVAGPGEVVAPILLYHHIDPEQTNPRYNVFPEVFAAQMQALEEWGYTTITAQQLIKAITEGEPLPPRPIVITFDDGHYSVYKYAFPIMQEHSFLGVTYIVANRLKSYEFTGVPQLEEMISAGWEVGSHGFTHSDLTLNHSIAFNEIFESRETLTEALSQPVKTIAYPYGKIDPYVISRTMKWGYLGAMGLGIGYTHNLNSIYYLQRIEVEGTYDMEKFASLLPWSSPID